VAADLRLDWPAVKEMDKLYMRAQLARTGELRLAVIGIDEISIRKGHVYRIIVSDLERQQPIWFGGIERSEESMAMFYDFLGTARSARLRLAVMDMWKAFRNATEQQAPQAAILDDKFHVLRHLNLAMDQGERRSTNGSPTVPSGPTSKGRSTRCSRTARISRRRNADGCRRCSRRTSGSIPRMS